MHAYIFNIQRFSIHDGPGIRTTIFFQGCPLECIWCHNPEGIASLSEEKDIMAEYPQLKKYSEEALLEEICKDRIFYEESGGGVTFSGGEPLMQADFLIKMLKHLKEENIHAVIDTSGYAPPDTFEKVCRKADLILFDLKLANNAIHKQYIGTDNVFIIKNLKFLIQQDIPFRIRIPLIHQITDTPENIEHISSLIQTRNTHIDLLPYHELGNGKRSKAEVHVKDPIKLKAPPEQRIREIKDDLASKGHFVHIGG